MIMRILCFVMILTKQLYALPGNYEVIAQEPLSNFYYVQDGKDVTYIDKFKGKIVILHFWSLSSKGYEDELSLMDRFMIELSPNVVFLPICLSQMSASQLKNRFIEQRYLNLPVLQQPGITMPKLKAVPTTLFLDQKGRLVGRIEGRVQWFDPSLKKLLNRLEEGGLEPTQTFWDKIKNRFAKMFFAQAADLSRINGNKGKKSMSTQHSTVLIIGSGPAGYTAAIYATRANLQTRLITGHEPGGQLTVTTDVENYPGFADVIQGPWLMEQMAAQAKKVGTEIITDSIVKADLSKRPFTLQSETGKTYTCDTLIISTGAQARWLGLASEKKYQGYGVSGCATCDGFFFKEQNVAVIGGGNTAVEDALYMSRFAKKVYLVHRRHELRAEKMLQDRLFKNPKIEIVWDHVVSEVLGKENPLGVTGVKLAHVQTKESKTLDVQGVFVAIGHTPRSELFKGQLDIASDGYINVKAGTTQTNIPGVYAAGDVADRVYRQAVTAAGLGCMAALEAQEFLAREEEKHTSQKVASTK